MEKRNISSEILNWIKDNPNKTLGIVLGFFISVLILAFGWGSIIIIIAMILGYIIGKSRDEGKSLSEVMEEIVPDVKKIEKLKTKTKKTTSKKAKKTQSSKTKKVGKSQSAQQKEEEISEEEKE